MRERRLQGNILIMLLAGILLLLALRNGFALDTAPDPIERQREEYRLKQHLKKILIDILKEEYVALSVNVLYVLQHDPIVSKKSKIKRLKLPGFGTQVTITNGENQISGYLDKYIRYRNLILMVRNRLSPYAEESLYKLLKEQEDLDLMGKDSFRILVVAEEREKPPGVKKDEAYEKDQERRKKDQFNQLLSDIDKKRTEQKERLAKLFPDLEQPFEIINPQKEAESSQHLILSRKAFYNNDLNLALNEVIEAINVNPYSPKSFEMLGSIYYRLKWNKLALDNWEKALALDPENKKLGKFIAKVKKEL